MERRCIDSVDLSPTQAREEASGAQTGGQVSGKKEDRREARGPETRGQARGQEARRQEVVRARVHRRAVAAAPRDTPTQAREEKTRGQEESREEEVARPQEKEVVA